MFSFLRVFSPLACFITSRVFLQLRPVQITTTLHVLWFQLCLILDIENAIIRVNVVLLVVSSVGALRQIVTCMKLVSFLTQFVIALNSEVTHAGNRFLHVDMMSFLQLIACSFYSPKYLSHFHFHFNIETLLTL